MTDKQIIIDDQKETIHRLQQECTEKTNAIIALGERLKAKEQECEELKEDLHQNFKENDKLNLIIDRLLEASGYDTNTVSDEDFEDVYKNMRYEKQQLDQLKAEKEKFKKECERLKNELSTYGATGICETCTEKSVLKCDQLEKENEELKQTLTEIKEICRFNFTMTKTNLLAKTILQKISECEVKNGN